MVLLTESSSAAVALPVARQPSDAPEHRQALLATAVAGPKERRLALVTIIVSTLVFAAAAPFAQVMLPPVAAFIPAYESALVLIDVITAVMLFGQFAQRGGAALLVLGAGYLFDGLMMIPHALSFPGLLTPTGWLGAGAQTTAWLYMFWHGGFPLFVMAYAMLKRRAGPGGEAVGPRGVTAVIAVTFVLAIALALVATKAHDLLPEVMAGNGYTPILRLVTGTVWALSAAALVTLAVNRPYSVLDLWLIVVMVAWLCDIALSAILNAGRFDFGFYAGRGYGLLAASFVLAVLLVETGALQVQLATAQARLEAHTEELARRVRERTAELAHANRQLNAILGASPLAIFMLDPGGKVVLWNPAAERIFGYRADEALGRLPPSLTDEHMADFRAILDHAANDPAAVGLLETQRRRKDGALIDVAVNWARVNDEAGEKLGIMYVVADMTERKKLETQLHHAQKMEAVGTLTGGLAHDFNNHLGVIILNLDVLRELPANDPEAEELTREAMAAAMRGAELIRRLLAFARRQPLQPERTDINELVGELAKLLQRTLGEEIAVAVELGDRVWPSVIDPAQLEASLMNLATNARDAMPGGGRLTIATGNRQLDADYASQHAEVTPGDYTLIEVSDSGQGMSPSLLAQVFEPFFTTKAPGKGTGLGLSMVYGFIKQSGGHIGIYSEVGVGTTVRLYLPRAVEGAAAAEVADASDLVRGGGECILAVEDNASLRRVVVRQLSEIGYRVLEADDAKTALAILQHEPVALLFSDVVLPGGMSGYELARDAAARWPELKIVLTSGFPENRIADDMLPNIRLLGKPYRKEDIARVIGNALADQAA